MTAAEKIMMDVEGKFWTRRDEMVEELEELDYEVLEINGEYISVVDAREEDGEEVVLYLGYAGSTIYVERAEEA